VQDEEIVANKKGHYDPKPQFISLKKGVKSISQDSEKKNKMEEGEYPIRHQYSEEKSLIKKFL